MNIFALFLTSSLLLHCPCLIIAENCGIRGSSVPPHPHATKPPLPLPHTHQKKEKGRKSLSFVCPNLINGVQRAYIIIWNFGQKIFNFEFKLCRRFHILVKKKKKPIFKLSELNLWISFHGSSWILLGHSCGPYQIETFDNGVLIFFFSFLKR